MPGVQRFGGYYLLKKIATGGMAELHKAKKSGEKGFEKLLAIKLILPHLSASDDFISMFIDEAKVAALLDHQNIVQIYDLGRIENSYCIVMEYVRGKDLRSVISRAIKMRMPISLEHSCLITANVLAGLSYAHRKKDKGRDLGIVHRDISPQNVLLSYEGEVKIVDFGIAKAATQSHDTQAGVLKGKLSYMSPEQALGRPLDRRSDVFSAGVVLYEMLTGRKLFRGDTDISTLEMVRAAKVEPLPSSLSKSFPAELEAILLKSLAREPEERYQSAAEMEAALAGFMGKAGYSMSGVSLSGYMYRLFREEIESEIRQEQEIDRADAAGSHAADAQPGAEKPPAQKTAPAPVPQPPKPRQAGSAPRPAATRPAPKARQTRGAGSLILAVVAVAAIAMGGAWYIMRPQGQEPSPAPAVAEEAVPVAGDAAEALPAAPAQEQPEASSPAETPAPGPAEVETAEPEPARESPPPPPAPASANITSRPPGAQVYLDGKPVGSTPAGLSGLEPGLRHSVRLKLAGYKDWTGDFTPEPGGEAVVDALLEAAGFRLDVGSTPSGARVLLDGADTGKTTPARLDGLALGRPYALGLVLDGYAPHEERVESDRPGPKAVSARLDRLYGQLTVNTRPWAFVFVDGENKGMTPLAGVRLPAGEHELVLDNPKAGLKKRMTVRIRPDEASRVVTDLGKAEQ